MANTKKLWQKTFVEYSIDKWGRNWVLGRKKLANTMYKGKPSRMITRKEYSDALHTWKTTILRAIKQGKAVPRNVVSSDIELEAVWKFKFGKKGK